MVLITVVLKTVVVLVNDVISLLVAFKLDRVVETDADWVASRIL